MKRPWKVVTDTPGQTFTQSFASETAAVATAESLYASGRWQGYVGNWDLPADQRVVWSWEKDGRKPG